MYFRSTKIIPGTVEISVLLCKLTARNEQGGCSHNRSWCDHELPAWCYLEKGKYDPGLCTEESSCSNRNVSVLQGEPLECCPWFWTSKCKLGYLCLEQVEGQATLMISRLIYFPILQEEKFSWFIQPTKTKVVRGYDSVLKQNQAVNNKEKRSL